MRETYGTKWLIFWFEFDRNYCHGFAKFKRTSILGWTFTEFGHGLARLLVSNGSNWSVILAMGWWDFCCQMDDYLFENLDSNSRRRQWWRLWFCSFCGNTHLRLFSQGKEERIKSTLSKNNWRIFDLKQTQAAWKSSLRCTWNRLKYTIICFHEIFFKWEIFSILCSLHNMLPDKERDLVMFEDFVF